MQALVIGNGGREHAIAWKLAQSDKVSHVWVAPGNAGTASEPKVQNINLSPTDIDALVAFAKEQCIDLTLVGPEAALAAGVVDAFQAEGLPCFGPTQKAAELESSKAFSKYFMEKHGIPTARYASFDSATEALAYLQTQTFPLVIKADGLAAGKGVVIAENLDQATSAITSMLSGEAFGKAGQRVVIEAFLEGIELSFIVMSDGKHILPLASSQDHKRRDEGDKGPNTGGMGAYSPAPYLTPELHTRIMQEVIEPTIEALQDEGTPYLGFLYAGLMISHEGDLHVLEYNCRLGDPETQPIMARLQSDLVELCLSALEGQLDQAQALWDSRYALTVVLAAEGYPNAYERGLTIEGLEKHAPDTKVFHAGTRELNGNITTNGGRVLGVTALGNTLTDAQQKAYALADNIRWPGRFFRRDIGAKAAGH